MLELIIFLISFIFVNFVLIYCSISDIRTRKIPNKIIKIFYLFGLGLIFIESLNYPEDLLFFVIIKSSFFLFSFLFSITLFSLEILGGSDGKLIILIISITPFKDLNYLYLFSFFLFFIFSISLWL